MKPLESAQSDQERSRRGAASDDWPRAPDPRVSACGVGRLARLVDLDDVQRHALAASARWRLVTAARWLGRWRHKYASTARHPARSQGRAHQHLFDGVEPEHRPGLLHAHDPLDGPRAGSFNAAKRFAMQLGLERERRPSLYAGYYLPPPKSTPADTSSGLFSAQLRPSMSFSLNGMNCTRLKNLRPNT